MIAQAIPRTVDVDAFSRSCPYAEIDLADSVLDLRTTLDGLVAAGIITFPESNTSRSVGIAMAVPNWGAAILDDDPDSLVRFVVGWGDVSDRVIANAVRKMRPAARTGLDSLQMVRKYPGRFEDVVEAQEADGSFLWGDFPYGGASIVTVGRHDVLFSVSGYTQESDDFVSKLLGARNGLAMDLADTAS